MESRFKSMSGKLALFAVMTAVTVVANLIMVPMPQPLAQYDASPVLIYALGVLLDPLMAGATIAAAMGIGVSYKMITFGFPPVFVVGAMLVRGIEAILISYLVRMRKGDSPKAVSRWEITAMIVGCVWETVGFLSLDWVLFGPGLALIDLATLVDLIFVPVAIAVVVAVRSRLGIYRLT
ncbi:TPA: hypothetical protein HA344_01095 [Candidatus Bathyarchaeota archaeon]|nr:hypothetical protein [Candidatus Bathyarchaeota archaeon]